MATQRLEQLKAKYQTVLDRMVQLGTQLQNVSVMDNKLVIWGHAKNKADSFRIWDQIRQVDGDYGRDLSAQITYPLDAAQAGKTYTAQPGDTLSTIALKYYGDARLFPRIFEANREQLNDRNKIHPGQILLVP